METVFPCNSSGSQIQRLYFQCFIHSSFFRFLVLLFQACCIHLYGLGYLSHITSERMGRNHSRCRGRHGCISTIDARSYRHVLHSPMSKDLRNDIQIISSFLPPTTNYVTLTFLYYCFFRLIPKWIVTHQAFKTLSSLIS